MPNYEFIQNAMWCKSRLHIIFSAVCTLLHCPQSNLGIMNNLFYVESKDELEVLRTLCSIYFRCTTSSACSSEPLRLWGTLMMQNQSKTQSTVNKDDVERHSKLMEVWWDRNGPQKALHSYNLVRWLAYFRFKLYRYHTLSSTYPDWVPVVEYL